MPVQSSLVRFQLSGGVANENPNLSLGSDISVATNRNIVSNFLHNLFDEVTNAESVTGEYEVRHFYYRNGADFKVKNAKLIVLADQTSIWSKLEFAKGTANNGNVEQSVPDENTLPVGISDSNWKIPNTLNPLVLGDVEAGSTASIWVRRKVEVGALIVKNEKVTIRIIADPVIPTAPPIICTGNTHYDATTNSCVPNEEDPDPDCPDGQHKDSNGVCVPNDGFPCPDGEHLEGNQCVPDGSPPVPEQVTVAIVGDIGCSSNADTVVFSVGAVADLDMFVANGDISYASTIDCFMEMLDQHSDTVPLNEITKITIGNHDDEEDGSSQLRQSFISAFGIPSGGYYSFDLQNIHFLMMDTQSSYAVNSAQYNFARNDLIAASQAANIDWIVVCYHKPSMTISSDHAALTDFRDIYHPLFDTYHVDFVISGHNHNMQRTHPVRHNTSSPTSPTVVSTGTTSETVNNIYIDVDGRVFVVSGAGGRAHDSLGSPPSHYAFGDDENFGFFGMAWFNNNKSVTCQFFTAEENTANIEELDSFIVHKSQ